jgi:putative transposase
MKNTCDQPKSQKSLELIEGLSKDGKQKVKSQPVDRLVDTGDISNVMCNDLPGKKNSKENELSTPVSPLTHKKKIWKDKLNISKESLEITKLSRILDQDSILREKVLTPFWNSHTEVKSKNLWLPTETVSVGSVSSLSKKSFPKETGKSWFSINEKRHLRASSSKTCSKSSRFSREDFMGCEVTELKKPSKIGEIKTLKMRIFPTTQEKKNLQTLFDQYRWYYNFALTVLYNHEGKNIIKKDSYSNYTVRDLFRKYDYIESEEGNILIKDFIYNQEKNEVPIPPWWKDQVHSRLPRGAIKKLVGSLNSTLSNLKNGNIKNFTMKYLSKKGDSEMVLFEDSSFPAFIKKIKSHYWYTTKDRKRKKISLDEIDTKKRGLEVIHDKVTKKYFLHYPVERDWFPKDDRRNDSQASLRNQTGNTIALDPGVRKFLVGYDPTGTVPIIGREAQVRLIKLLKGVDTLNGRRKLKAWRRIKNLIKELHWKTAKYLVSSYDIILLPDFRISGMLRGKKLGKMTKKLLCMFSFYSFKEKLIWKCSTYGKKLIIVDESYTSRTCGKCGTLSDIKGQEVFECHKCGLITDRDINGARNIFLKNLI